MSLMNYPMMNGAGLYDGYHRGFGGGLYGAHMQDGMFGNGYGRGFGGFGGFGDFGYGSQVYGMPQYGHSSFGMGSMLGSGYPYSSMGPMYYDNPYGSRFSNGRYGYGHNGYGRGGALRRSHSLGSMRHGRFY